MESEKQSHDDSVESKPSALTPAMRRVLWGVGIIVAVGVAAAIWFFAAGGAGAPSGASATEQPGDESSSAATTTPGAIPGATPTTGSEVQSPNPTATTGLPPLPATTPLVEAPLPASGSAEGTLVVGFPTDLMGPAPDSDIISSSIATEGDVMQVTLVARTDASADDIRAHYRTLWADLGLTDAGATAGADVAYSDAFSSMSLAFTSSSGTGTVYTVFGVFRTS